ncbi:MAG: 1,2-phenylacetyl-CoA epoxidase subunit PaaE [Pseudonocardiaceae bacterium]
MVTGGFHPLRVAAVQRLCADAVAVTFDVPAELADTFRFRAGQYVTLRRGEERRCYSICAAEGASLRIGVRRVAAGSFSEWLVDRVAAGDQIEVGAPTGRFTCELTADTRHVMIAAGSGITPVLSLMSTVLAAEPSSAVTLLYGNRRSETVMFLEELADLKNAYGPRLQLVHVLSREPLETEILHGRLDAVRLHTLLTALVPIDEVDHWWLCGPLGMTADARAVLTELGIPAGRVHRELFYVEDLPPAPVRPQKRINDGVTATVILEGRTTTLHLPRDIPVLDAAQRVRTDLPFACKGGVCGSCRAKLTAGEVRMRRNFALEPQEVAAGYILTCQSLPVSAELTLDYDS